MPNSHLTQLLIDARKSNRPLDRESRFQIPSTADEADAVQVAVIRHFGPIAGYKVFQVEDRDGCWGAIPAPRVMDATSEPVNVGVPMKVEAEIAFRFKEGLPARGNGNAYTAEEVWAAVGEAFAAFELLDNRYPFLSAPDPLFVRADSMGNYGLVCGMGVSDWREQVKADVGVKLEIAGRRVVDQRGGHPAGDPAHPLTWLANALAGTDHPIKAGDVVTTGAFGGGHAVRPGERAVAEIEGFAAIEFICGAA